MRRARGDAGRDRLKPLRLLRAPRYNLLVLMLSVRLLPPRRRLAFTTKPSWGWSLRSFVRVLRRHDLRFVVIGSVATCAYVNRPQAPADFDIVLGRREETAQRAFAALVELLRFFPPVGTTPEFSTLSLAAGMSVVLPTCAGRVHFVGVDVGCDPDVLVGRSHRILLDQVLLPVCALDDLVALKQRDARPCDIADLELLKSVTRHVP